MSGRKDGSGGRSIGRGHQRIGVMPCLACEREIPVKKTEGGKLSCSCTWCDLPLYVNPRTEAFDLVMRRVKVDAPPAADPGAPASAASSSPASASPPAPAKEAPPARSSFTSALGNPFGSRS